MSNTASVSVQQRSNNTRHVTASVFKENKSLQENGCVVSVPTLDTRHLC